MSETVEVVENLLGPYSEEDVLPRINAILGELGSKPKKQAIINALEADKCWSLYSADLVFDMRNTGLGKADGIAELPSWWRERGKDWATYSYTVEKYEQVGSGEDTVLTFGEVTATAQNGQAVRVPLWQTWQVQNGKVSAMQAFLSEDDARRAVR
jgi:hypothetical protein